MPNPDHGAGRIPARRAFDDIGNLTPFLLSFTRIGAQLVNAVEHDAAAFARSDREQPADVASLRDIGRLFEFIGMLIDDVDTIAGVASSQLLKEADCRPEAVAAFCRPPGFTAAGAEAYRVVRGVQLGKAKKP